MSRTINITLVAALALLFTTAACEVREMDVIEGSADTTRTDTVNVLTSDEEGDGWQMLFAGDDLSNWRGFQTDSVPGKWVVDDNAIHFDPDEPGSGGDLVTREQYRNFELSFEWKISECGNSGVIYLASADEQYEQPWNTGPEYQILDNTCHPDAEVGEHRHAAAAYDVYGPATDVTRPAGEWNQSRIVVDSMHVEHWLNGTKVVEYELGSDDFQQRVSESKWTDYPDYGTVEEGYIAFQDHGDPVWYRKIRIREL